MSQEWYYTQNGERQGPVSPKQLKQLVTKGEIQPTDLVWTEGKDEWIPASSIKGLFQAKKRSKVKNPPPTIPAESTSKTPPVPAPPSATDTGSVPALWNPKALRAWSLLFTLGFGAFLLARNWKALGDEGRAKRAMYWFYSAIAFLVLAFLTPDSPSIIQAFRGIGIVFLVAWLLLEAHPQIKFLKDNFNDTYQRKPWGKPLGIGASALLGIVLLAMVADMGLSGGSITFAEEVDPKTFETTNEGTEFTTGWVNMIIRGNGAFGDNRLIVSFRKDEEMVWQILGEHIVDAEWDVVAIPIQLRDPGNYEIVVKTSSGTIIAQNSVTILQ